MRIDQFNSPYADYGYRGKGIPSVNAETVKIQETDQTAKERQYLDPGLSHTDSTPLLQEDKRSRMAPLEDISLSFQKEDSYDYIGKDSSLQNLDMQKAISDMKKDNVLEEYQYFVGSAADLNAGMGNEDGIVILKGGTLT